VNVHSQHSRQDFSHVDRSILGVDDHSPAQLAYKLTAPFHSDLEKVRAIFRWIAENIAYHVYTPTWRGTVSTINYEAQDDAMTDLKPLNERISNIVLKKRTAICDQYARLFKTLCDYAGICSEIISGYARPDMYRSPKRFTTNHTWNAVQIDGTWHLLDVTWASGYLSYNRRAFIKSFDDYYFLTAPEKFIRDHYPDNLHWTLLDVIPPAREYEVAPYRYSEFIKSKVKSYFPEKGILKARVGDTLHFEMETGYPAENFFVSSHMPQTGDPAIASQGFTQQGKKISMIYVVPADAGDRIYVMLNDNPVLRYRFVLKQPDRENLAKLD
jgi:hypothetical protein